VTGSGGSYEPRFFAKYRSCNCGFFVKNNIGLRGLPGVEPAGYPGKLQICHLVRLRLRVGGVLALPGERTLGG
jgi:hypothetical protein